MAKIIDMKGMKIKNLTVIEYVGNSKWKCKCDCNEIVYMDSRVLRNGRFAYCNKVIDNSIKNGAVIGELTVKQILDTDNIICECSCGNSVKYTAKNILDGKKSCGHEKVDNMIGKVYGDWKVIKYALNNKCTCIDLKTQVVRDVNITDLVRGASRSSKNAFIDLSGKQIGNWKVLEYDGNGKWLCECQCDDKTLRLVSGQHLRRGASKSCGCMHRELQLNTMISKYSEINMYKACEDTRDIWQIETLNSKDKLYEYLVNKSEKPTIYDISNELNITKSTILKKLKLFGLEEYVNLKPTSSKYETEIISFLVGAGYNVEKHMKNIISPYELDIYIPEKKLAIEFNGTYWHSDDMKNKYYHQQKTLACAKQGIRLIHIFEYEWRDDECRNKLYNILCDDKKLIYARNTCVKSIENGEEKEFTNRYHLQGNVNSLISIGLYYDNNIIGIMTFGKPRFNNKYEYEIIRVCWKDNIGVIGGLEKLFKYFIKNYNPHSIITYVDISKFTGNSYLRLGFKPIQPNPITEPNYVWVEPYKNIVLSRYRTQKHKLIKQGLGNMDDTEDSIMKRHNFLKIYDSGNIKMEWRKEDGSKSTYTLE